jgi:hypothetical protein
LQYKHIRAAREYALGRILANVIVVDWLGKEK